MISPLMGRIQMDELQQPRAGYGRLGATYDQFADVLYLFLDPPEAAFSEEGPDGICLRRRESDEAPCGVTVLNYWEDWGDLQERLASHVAAFLSMPVGDVSKALPTPSSAPEPT